MGRKKATELRISLPDDSFPDEPSSVESSSPVANSSNASSAPPVLTSHPGADPVPHMAEASVPMAAPVAPLVAVVSSTDPALEERLRRLEQVVQEQMKWIQQGYAHAAPLPAVTRPPTPAGDGWWWHTVTFLGGAITALPQFLTGGTTNPNRPAWWLETLAEMRAMQRMFVDPRYTMSWIGRIVPVVLMLLFVFPYYWVPGATFLGWLIERPAQLLVAYFLVRTLQWEARRYRETAPDLPPSLRL